jgi:hypothetical protein
MIIKKTNTPLVQKLPLCNSKLMSHYDKTKIKEKAGENGNI